jgi:hypothetical protein
MEIISDTYRVTYDPATKTVTFRGKLRLYDRAAYEPIEALLEEVASTETETITLDVQPLEFLNSSGIDLIHGFAIKVRNRAVSQLIARGSLKEPWQAKLLANMQRLVPSLQIEMA